MKRSRFSEKRLIRILKEHQAGFSAADLCREHGISDATWRSKCGGMEVSEAKRLKALEEENRRLKKPLAEQVLDNATLKEAFGKKLLKPSSRRNAVDWAMTGNRPVNLRGADRTHRPAALPGYAKPPTLRHDHKRPDFR